MNVLSLGLVILFISWLRHVSFKLVYLLVINIRVKFGPPDTPALQKLTLNLPTTTIVVQPFNVITWQLKFNPVT